MQKNIHKFLFVLMSLVLSLVLVACGSEESSSSGPTNDSNQSSEASSNEKDTLHLISNEIPYFLNPNEKFSGTYWRSVRAIETLMDVTPEGEVVPGFAESLNQVDDHNWEFTLPEDATFWSGTPVTADEIVRSTDRYRTESADGASLLEGLTFEAIEDKTVRVVTERANQNVPIILTDVFVFQADADYTSVETTDFTGPYQITEYLPKQRTSLTVYENYYGDKPQIQNILWEEMQDPDARALAAQNGDADIVQNLTPNQIPPIEQAGESDVYTIDPSGTLSVYVNLQRPPFDDKNVRQALSWALDRDELALLAFDGVPEPSSTWLGTNPQFQDQRHAVYDKQDVGLAEDLLAESGWEMNDAGLLEKDGQTMDFTLFTWGNDKLLGEAVQSQWSAIGVNVDLQHVDYSLIEEARQTGEWDGLIETWTNYGDYYPIAYGHFGPDGSVNYGSYQNDTVNAALEGLNQTADPGEQHELMTTINLQVAEDAPLISLMPRPIVNAVSKDLDGFEPHFINHMYLVNEYMSFK